MIRLRPTVAAHEPRTDFFPGNALDRSRLQIRSTPLDLGDPGGVGLFILIFFEAVEETRGNFRAISLIQLQSLSDDFFDVRSHGSSVAWLPAPPRTAPPSTRHLWLAEQIGIAKPE